MALAEFSQTVENARAMNPRNCAGRLVAALVFSAFVWALALTVAPQWHERIHADANRVEHSCAVTFIAAGNYEHSDSPALVSAPEFAPRFRKVQTLHSVWVQPLFFVAHIFAHAPPAGA